MPQTACCPDEQTFKDLMAHQLPPERLEAVLVHLETCAACVQTVEALGFGSDYLVAAMRKIGSLGDSSDAATVQRMLGRLTDHFASLTVVPGATESQPGPAWAEVRQCLAPPQAPDEMGWLGPYRVLRLLGHGGMGMVFEAEDPQLQRRVALKVMKPSLAADVQARQRFLREARAIAAITHEHIITIYQVGEDRGVPFLAMQFLEGMTLEQRLKQAGRLTLPQVLRLARQVASGLAAAHARGLVHRDIKPGNLWLETPAGEPGASATGVRVKVLDFGLAYVASPGGDAGESALTASGMILGTPAYMAPEQARGRAVDVRADLFSLGCVLYELTTGQRPFPGRDALAILASLAADTPPAPRTVQVEVPTALSELVMRLLEKDPAKRPASATVVEQQLAEIEDRNDRQLACRPEATGKLPVATRRRRVGMLVAVAVLGLLGGGVVLQQILIRIYDKDGKQIGAIAAPPGSSVTIGAAKPPPDEPLPPGASPFDRFRKEDIPESERFAWQPKELVAVLGEHRQRPWGGGVAVAFSPDGKTIAIRSHEGLQLRDAATGQRFARVPNDRLGGYWPAEHRRARLQFSNDGRMLATNSLETIVLLDVPTLRERTRFSGCTFAFAPNGRTLAYSPHEDSGPEIIIWDVVAEKVVTTLPGAKKPATALVFSPDEKRLASGAGWDWLKIWDIAARKEHADLGKQQGIVHLTFSADGTLLAGSHGQNVVMWDATTGRGMASLPGIWGPPVAFAPDGQTLAVGHTEEKPPICLYDATTWTKRTCFENARANSLAYSPDGKVFVSAGDALLLWDAVAGTMRQTLQAHKGAARAVVYSADGQRLLSGGDDRVVKLWNATTGKEGPATDAHPHEIHCVAMSPDRKTIASGARDGVVRLHDAATGKEQQRIEGHLGWVQGLAFTPDGKTLLSASKDNTVKLWDPVTGKLRDSLTSHVAPVHAVACSRDGKLLATAGDDKTARLWDAITDKELAVLEGHTAPVLGVSFAPDGKTLATASEDGSTRIWDVATHKNLLTLTGHEGAVRCVAFAPDGKTLATGGQDGTVRLWLAGVELEWVTLHGHTGPVWSVAFSPDGGTIASAGQDGKVLLRQTAKRVPGWEYPPKTAQVLAISPDGKLMVTRTWGGKCHLVDIAANRETPSALAHIEGIESARFTPDGKTIALGSGGKPVRLIDVATGTERSFEGGTVANPQFAPEGKTFAAVQGDRVTVWDLELGKRLIAVAPPLPDPVIYHSSKMLVLFNGIDAEMGKVFAWDIATGKERPTKAPPFRDRYAAPDGMTLILQTKDKKYRQWDLVTDQETWVLGEEFDTGITRSRYAPGSKALLAVMADSDLALIDGATGKSRALQKGHTAKLRDMAFSADSKLLATWDEDAKVILWDVASAKALRSWTLPGVCNTVLFAPDGRHLVLNNSNGTAYVLRLDSPTKAGL